MKLIQRFGFYFGGFSIGLVILIFVFTGKRASCSYGPEARVLKNIGTKHLVFGEAIQEAIHNHDIDSSTINYILKEGSVDFSKSVTKRNPCNIYAIEQDIEQKTYFLTVENCDSIATVQTIKW